MTESGAAFQAADAGKTKLWQRRWVWMIAGILTAALVVGFWPTSRSTADRADESGRARVSRGDLRQEVPAIGSLAAHRSVDIGPPAVEDMWNFKIARLIGEGTYVKPGDVLVEFDGEQVVRELMEHTSEMNKTQEELTKRKLEYDIQMRDLRLQFEQARVAAQKARHKADVDASLSSMQDYKQAQIELEQAETEFKRVAEKTTATERMKQAELAALENNLAKAKGRVERDKLQQKALSVVSPTSGVVVFKKDWRGEKKQVGQTSWRMETIMQLPDLSTLRLEATVEETHAGRVAVGQTASIRLDAFPEEKLTGKVIEMGRVLRTKRWDMPVKVVDAIIELDRLPEKLLPGMTATVQIEVERISNVLLAPFNAVKEKNGRAVVRVVSAARQTEERPIRVGRRNQEFVEVLEGLKEGDTVLVR